MSYAQKFFSRILALLLVMGFLSMSALPVQSQEGIALEEPGANVRFGETITFHAKIKSAIPIQQALLLFRNANRDTTYAEAVQVAEDGSVSFVYDASLNAFPPFSKIQFWFQVTLADNKTYTSDIVAFDYNDTRFPWRATQRANVIVHWYAGDDTISANALEMAGAGMIEMRDLVNVSLTEPLHIYIYSNPGDLQATMMLGGKEWVAGHAISDIGVILVAISPEAPKSEFETKIPHEMAHVLLYRALGRERYDIQPTWLVEGIASMMEKYPDPEYKRALDIASEKDTLIPFVNLCKGFPPDTGGAYLAYAQSQSFVKYIYESQGASGLTRLLNVYGDGFNCDQGATKALSVSLSQLDVQWRENVLQQNVLGVATRNLAPFVLIMALVSIVPLWGMIDLMRQRRKREEKYAEKPKLK
jgi:hypothetical protein